MSNNPKGRIPRACPWVSTSKPVFTLFFSLLIPLFANLISPLSSFAETQTEETLTITTYYPAPYGVYNEMRSKRMAVGDNYINGSTFSWDTGTIDANADLVVEGNVGIGTTAPSAGGEQNLKLDVEGAVGARYYCDENGNKCASAPLSSIVSVQSNALLLTSFSSGSTNYNDVISLSIDTTGSNILASVTCGWTRRGGSYQVVLAGRLLLDGGSDIEILPDIGGWVNNQTLEQAMSGGGQALFTGMAPGSPHTIKYQIAAKYPWSGFPGPYYDIFTTDSDHCRMILLSY